MIGNNHTLISGAASTTVSPRPGILQHLAIGTPIAGATIAVYDGEDATGAKIADITLPGDVSAMPPSSMQLGVKYETGLFVVTTGAGLELTVAWI